MDAAYAADCEDKLQVFFRDHRKNNNEMIVIFQKVFGKEKAPLKTKSWFQKGGGRKRNDFRRKGNLVVVASRTLSRVGFAGDYYEVPYKILQLLLREWSFLIISGHAGGRGMTFRET